MLRTLLLKDAPSGELTIDVPPTTSLLEVMRKHAGRKSVVRGCADYSCGACRVLVDGQLHASCKLLWRDLPEKSTISTFEDIADDPTVMRAVAAFEEERATRCRLCVGALGVTTKSLERKAAGSDVDVPSAIEHALQSATCMCTGRGSLRRAITKAFATSDSPKTP